MENGDSGAVLLELQLVTWHLTILQAWLGPHSWPFLSRRMHKLQYIVAQGGRGLMQKMRAVCTVLGNLLGTV